MHPTATKTKIVYCKDDARRGAGNHIEHTQFDFLGYTLRAGTNKRKRTGQLYNNFTPAVSMSAKKAMRRKIKELKIRQKTLYSLEKLSSWLSLMLNGWINYYVKFRCSKLGSVFRHWFNKTLVR